MLQQLIGAQLTSLNFPFIIKGEMLGFSQSGIRGGFAVDPANHWELLAAATTFGRSFTAIQQHGGSRLVGSSPTNDTLVQLAEGKITSLYDRTSASSTGGLALRLMMSLFGEWKRDESNTLDAINTLQNLDASKGELSQDDKSIDAKIVALAQAFVSSTETPFGLEKSVLPIKPRVAALKPQVSRLMHVLSCLLSLYH